MSGSYTQDKLNRLNQEIFWIDTSGTSEWGALNKKKIWEYYKTDEKLWNRITCGPIFRNG